MQKVNLPDRYAQMEADIKFKNGGLAHGGFWLELAQFMKENDIVYLEVLYGDKRLASEPIREGVGVQSEGAGTGQAELPSDQEYQRKGRKGRSLFTKKG
jgi:hypothetical protein